MPASSRPPAAEVGAPVRPRHATQDRDSDPDIRLLRGAAEPNRLAILRRLQCGGSVAACDFNCCDVHQPTVSHHLRVLREAGWVRAERRASHVYYSLQPAAAERFLSIAHEFGPWRGPSTSDAEARAVAAPNGGRNPIYDERMIPVRPGMEI